MILFDLMKQLLTDAVNDSDFVKKNTILQDNYTKQELLSRISKLQRVYPITKTFAEITQTSPDAPTGSVSVDYLNRQITITASLGVGTGTFQLVEHPPLKLFGWTLSPDSTILTTEFELQYRTSATDPWKKLLQQDHVDNVTNLQLRISVPVAVATDRVLKSIVIFAEQI